ncbi:MAG: hypothetical protein LLF95_04785 [Bacteroidales bacterium]|nr:hypothetical protein [Bacteroidales bacterium]
MATESTKMSLSDLFASCTVLSANIKLNAEKISRYGLELPAYTNELDADVQEADRLNKEQERLKSELKSKTAELDLLKAKLQQSYALGKKTVKLAEPQINWVAYGIADKR